jgi:hypothetical protein
MMILTTEQIIDDLRQRAERFDEAANVPLAPHYAANCRSVADELRNAAAHYARDELMVKEES